MGAGVGENWDGYVGGGRRNEQSVWSSQYSHISS